MSDDRPTISLRHRQLPAALIGTWGLYQVLAGLYFIFIRPSLLPEDLRAAVTSLEALRTAAPNLEGWLQLVFTVLGGQMAAVGVLLICAANRIRGGARLQNTEIWVYAAAGVLSVALMSGVNFVLGSDFRWHLVAPVLIWLFALVTLSSHSFARSTRGRR